MSQAGGQAAILAPGAPQRLHPLTMVTRLGDVLRKAWGAAAAAAFLAYSGRWWIAALLVAAVLVGSLLRPLVQWLTFTYEVGEDGIELKSGLLSRTHRAIPFDRLQDVNLEQNPLHRLTRLAKVKLETGGNAGGREDDGIIDSIGLADAALLQATIRAYRSGIPIPDATDADHPVQQTAAVYAMPLARVLLAGVFNFSLAVIGLLFGAAQTLGDLAGINPFAAAFWRGLADSSSPFLDLVLANRVVTALAGLVSLVAIGLATGLVQTLLREFGFALERTESGLRRRRGLLTLTDVVLPIKRVQAMILATGPIRRRFGYAELRLQSLASDSGHGGDHVVAPLARATEIDAIVATMGWRALDPSAEGWRRPTLAYLAGFLALAIPLTAIGLGLALVQARPALGAGIAGLAALLLAARVAAYRHHSYRREGDRVMVRSGAWRQRHLVLPLDRIQSIDLHRTPLDRMLGVSSMRFGVAGGRGLQRHAIHAIPHHEALALRAGLVGDT